MYYINCTLARCMIIFEFVQPFSCVHIMDMKLWVRQSSVLHACIICDSPQVAHFYWPLPRLQRNIHSLQQLQLSCWRRYPCSTVQELLFYCTVVNNSYTFDVTN